MNSILKGKKGLIMGVANERSIAWSIAKAACESGAQIAMSYQGEVIKKRIEPLAGEVNCEHLFECDVTNTESVDKMFLSLRDEFGELDFLVHSIAFSDKNELRGRYVDTSRENFLNTMDISCFSFVYCAKKASELMKNGGSIITLTYYGAEKVMPNYNVMGVAKAALEASVKYAASDLGVDNIRVNGISAGPMKTLAAAGIGDFKSFLKLSENTSPLRRNTSYEDIIGSSLFLLSNLSSGVTGEILHVDSGYNIMGCSNAA